MMLKAPQLKLVLASPCLPLPSLALTLVHSASSQNGDVHINVAAVNVMLGLQVQALNVFPQHVVPHLANDRWGCLQNIQKTNSACWVCTRKPP